MGVLSGLKLIVERTEALWFGSNYRDDEPPHISIKKVNKSIKILGVYFTYDCRKKDRNLIFMKY